MTDAEETIADKAGAAGAVLKCRMSKLEFPEFCPVCMREPEDLVTVTVIEKSSFDRGPDNIISDYMGSRSEVDVALARAKGAATFWVPTCMRHGTGSLRTDRSKLVAVCGFFGLFYIVLYYVLAVINAIQYSRPLLVPAAGLAISFGVMILLLLYGAIPRALERKLKFLDIDRGKDIVYLKIMNPEYAEAFLEQNEMHADIVKP
ncbi:hypothetical protein EU545_03745 [Candidatus Thorarchaeota archaeon]|nr:MAG: hypothetical protein EU545_03745 [Candidatus Thorarchaeota archaeon]